MPFLKCLPWDAICHPPPLKRGEGMAAWQQSRGGDGRFGELFGDVELPAFNYRPCFEGRTSGTVVGATFQTAQFLPVGRRGTLRARRFDDFNQLSLVVSAVGRRESGTLVIDMRHNLCDPLWRCL